MATALVLKSVRDLDVLSDSRAIFLGNTLPASTADGYVRVIRVSRGNTQTISANRETDTGSTIAFAAITVEPTVTSLDWVDLGNNTETDINATSCAAMRPSSFEAPD